MIFVTVGSRSFPFDRLLRGIDQAISEGKISDEVFAQTGSGSYQPRFFEGIPFLDHDRFEEKMKEADLIIAHGGTGVIMNALKMGKRVVAVPRLPELKEVVDDNQVQLIRELEKAGLVTACYDCSRIGDCVSQAESREAVSYVSNADAIISSIDRYLDSVWRETGDKKRKVLMVSNMYPGKSCPSAGTFVRNLYGQMRECGADVRLSVMKWHKGKWWKLWAYPLFYLSTFLRLLFFTYDMVYIQYASHSSPPVLWARRFRSLRIYTNVHGSDVVPSNARQRWFQRYTVQALKASEKTVVPSMYFKRVVMKKYHIPEGQVVIVPSGGIDPAIFYPFTAERRAAVRKKYGVDESLVTFVYAGRLVKKKGYDVFLRAVRRLRNCGYRANYLLVGDGDGSGEVEEMMHRYGLEKEVMRFPLLPQIELSEIYNAADVFVFPTMRKEESLGLSAIEAMACGLPVIGSDYAAPRYYIHDGVNGYKFPAGDDEALAENMAGFIEGRFPVEKLRKGAIAAAGGYDSEICRKAVEQLLGQIPCGIQE